MMFLNAVICWILLTVLILDLVPERFRQFRTGAPVRGRTPQLIGSLLTYGSLEVMALLNGASMLFPRQILFTVLLLCSQASFISGVLLSFVGRRLRQRCLAV